MGLVVRDGLNACNPLGRQAGVAALFGDFTRRAIAAGVDRTRFVDWLGPMQLVSAPAGRIRGRVLYFNNAKGRGKVLGSDRIVYVVYFSMIEGDVFGSLDAGQLVEFTAWYGAFNSGPGLAAIDLVRLTDGPTAEPSTATAG